MKRIPTIKEYIADESLCGSDIWILTKYQHYVDAQRYKIPRDDVSTSFYLYGVSAKHFNNLITSQDSFISVRRKYLETTIRAILSVDTELRDDERLRACLKARAWCDKMSKEISDVNK